MKRVDGRYSSLILPSHKALRDGARAKVVNLQEKGRDLQESEKEMS